MRLSASNIAWPGEWDVKIYSELQKMGYAGLEIAPTRIIQKNPYNNLEQAENWQSILPFKVVSMQSIWFGRSERIAESLEEYQTLLNYTDAAICFAKKIGCRNLVFGCPKNRTIKDAQGIETVKRFLDEAATIAANHDIVIALEANPTIYNTNFATHTEQAIGIIRELKNPGLMLNLDFGTMLENGECVSTLEKDVDIIHHVHISEPYLKPIQRRKEHSDLKALLESNNYQGYISLEMARQDDMSLLMQKLDYIKEVFA